MKKLPKHYDHKEAEPRLQKRWEEIGVHAWDESQPRENTFVIDTPPPTVSGILHMGHIFSYTQADFVARYQRMRGKTVFYPMGFDDNGLPTERLVEKEKKVRGRDMPRADFVVLCREVVKGAEEEFRRLFKSVALSVDWKQEYQTISDDVRRLSQESFLDLLEKGDAYRDFRPTYWDWVDQTAIAQAEIENKEMPGVMNEIEFTLEDGTPLIIATTRPELLGACVAVMYHPEDPNAAKYRDKYAVTPLFGVNVPMIADELVEREKGTGLVMCCTFGDDTDKEWWRKHGLPLRQIVNELGRIDISFPTFPDESKVDVLEPREEALFEADRLYDALAEDCIVFGGANYALAQYQFSRATIDKNNCLSVKKAWDVFNQINGLKIKQANEKIVKMLQTEGKLCHQTLITHTVKCAERSGTPIEIIPTPQWFIRITDKKEALLEKGKECKWYPEYMHIRLNQWIDGLKEDWCISRQRFFGVPFPVWYSKRAGEEGRPIFASSQQLPVDPLTDLPHGYTREEVVASTDVMDTWATSSISPQINAGSIGIRSDKHTDTRHLTPETRFTKLFPADLRPQAHEIIRTWAFYTIVKAHLHSDDIPWKNLMISGWCLASDKSKMSKSKGNIITPVDLILEKSADAVRYWASTSRLGADTAFSEELLKIGKKLINKLWNAINFASLHLETLAIPSHTPVSEKRITETLDKWILTRLQKTIEKATHEFEKFEYCDARVAIEEFFWKDFCDNYLELVKTRAYGEEVAGCRLQVASITSARVTLYYCLHAILRLFAPFIPHITEELYSHIVDADTSVHARGNWPKSADYPIDNQAEASGIACVSILEAIRKCKSERQVSIKFPIKEVKLSGGDWKLIEPVIHDLKSAGNVESITWSDTLASDAIYLEDRSFAMAVTFADNPSNETLYSNKSVV